MDRLSRGNLGYRKAPSSTKGATLDKPRPKRTLPNEAEEKLLLFLSQTDQPATTGELAKHLRLQVASVLVLTRWLSTEQFIASTIRKTKNSFSGLTGSRKTAFWTLSDKGVAYVSGRRPGV